MFYSGLSPQARLNLLLFIGILVLSLLAWYQPGLKKIQVQLFSTLKKESIHHIIIEQESLASIKLSRINDHWFMEEPYSLPANPLRVETITALAQTRSYSRFPIQDADLERYQLDKPSISVWLNDQHFILGSTHPINKQRYAMNSNANKQADHQIVHLINGIIYYQLRATLNTFISPLLLPPAITISSIHWGNKILTINNHQWQLSPENSQVSSENIAQFLQHWQTIEASKVEINLSLSIDKEELLNNQTISIHYMQTLDKNKGEQALKTIHYVLLQEETQLKLLRTDLNIAYWISPQQLQYITQFMPVNKI